MERYHQLVSEVCYQVIDCVVKDFRQFLLLLNQLPHYQYLPPVSSDVIVMEHFTDAVKEFGLSIGFAMQPYWHYTDNNDILFSLYQEGMIAVLLFQKDNHGYT